MQSGAVSLICTYSSGVDLVGWHCGKDSAAEVRLDTPAPFPPGLHIHQTVDTWKTAMRAHAVLGKERKEGETRLYRYLTLV